MYTETKLGEGQSPASNRNPASANSIMVVDCGSVFTKVSLLGLVEGQYRLMARGEAPTSLTAPNQDITRGIIQAINRIEYITGRHFVSGGQMISPERPSGDGVDVFVATVSVGGPMRVVVLGGVSAAFERKPMQYLRPPIKQPRLRTRHRNRPGRPNACHQSGDTSLNVCGNYNLRPS